jgi:hypothetical protein
MWYSSHSFGVPLLLSPFLLAAQYVHIAPLAALQLGMVFLQALGIVVLYLYTLELVRHNGTALAAALTLLGSLSFFSLVGQLFPDLLTPQCWPEACSVLPDYDAIPKAYCRWRSSAHWLAWAPTSM